MIFTIFIILNTNLVHLKSPFSSRLLVERIFAQYMVPHNLETTERMKCLYYLYATLDLNAVKYVSSAVLLLSSCSIGEGGSGSHGNCFNVSIV